MSLIRQFDGKISAIVFITIVAVIVGSIVDFSSLEILVLGQSCLICLLASLVMLGVGFRGNEAATVGGP